MTPFDLIEPASLKEAIEQIDPDDPDVRPIAGGTALMLMMKAGVFRPRRLVSLRKLAKTLGNIERTRDGELLVGALTPLSVLENSPEIARNVPVITRTMRRLANTRVRNVATVGGALAHGDPHMDLPPVLIALGAEIRVAGPKSERAMKVEDLFTGYYETAIARNELITHVSIPAQGAVRSVYFKVTAGSADDWPSLGVAVAIENANAGVKSARIVVSAATTKAMRLKSAEKTLVGGLLDEKVVANAADAAVGEAEIIADLRGSASYKRELVRVYVARAVRSAMQGTSP